MMLCSKSLIKKTMRILTAPQTAVLYKQFQSNLYSSSLLFSRNRSFFSSDNSDKNNQIATNDAATEAQKQKKLNKQRRQRMQEKEQSDDSDNESDKPRLLKRRVVDSELESEDGQNNLNDANPNSLKNARGYSAYDSNDSLENLVSFENDQDENFQTTQKLIDKIMKGEVEFNEGDSIDKLMSLDDVFKTREKRLSFQLMNIDDPLKIFSFYQQEVERINQRNGEEDPLTMDEVALFFYFAAFQKKFISDNKDFQKLLLKIIEGSKDLSVHSLQTFIWSLGSYMYEFGQIELTENMKKIFADSILPKCKNFEYDQNTSLCFALSQIFSGQNDGPLTEPIVNILATASAEYIETLSHDELITMIMTFMTIGFSNTSTISKYVQRLVEIQEELSEEQIQKAISALGELNYGNSKQFASLTKEIIDRDAGKQDPDMTLETACSLIFTLSGAQEKNEDLLKKLLRIVHSKYKEINITNYVNVWLGLARFRIDTTKYEQTFTILHKVLGQGHVFQVDDLNNDELIRIIVAASSLKLNNKGLMGDLFSKTQTKLRNFNTDQLLLLTRASVIYVKQFESFFIAVHGECLAKLDKFTFEQKSLLKQTFSRTRILFPDSPLIDTRI